MTILTPTHRSEQQEEHPGLVHHGKGLENEAEPERLVAASSTLTEEYSTEEQPYVKLKGGIGTWRNNRNKCDNTVVHRPYGSL